MKQRIVIKVGTNSLLTGKEEPRGTFETVAASVTALRDEYDNMLVTSGAIGFGVRQRGLENRPQDVSQLQALSAIGQVALMDRWRRAFAGTSEVAQVLLTARELAEPRHVATLTSTLEALWCMRATPIVNENDAIANEEIGFGDNDQLAALAAASIDAKQLVLLTDQDGIQENFGTSRQRSVRELSLEQAQQHVDTATTAFGTGGMITKLIAARIALRHGIETYIGSATQPVASILAGKSGTKIVQ